jgi:hypothetical protein
MPYYARPDQIVDAKRWVPGCPIRRVRRRADQSSVPAPAEYPVTAAPPLAQSVEPELPLLKGWQKGLEVIRASYCQMLCTKSRRIRDR